MMTIAGQGKQKNIVVNNSRHPQSLQPQDTNAVFFM